jgi:hypothetical protein
VSHRIVTEQVPAPAAGSDWAFTPSSTDRVLLLSVTAKLTTSAAAANRRPALALEDQNDLTYWSADSVFPQAASLAVTYSWARGASNPPAAAIVTLERVALPMPWLRLQPNDAVESDTALLDVADAWTNIVYRAVIGDWWEDEAELAYLARALAIGAAG